MRIGVDAGHIKGKGANGFIEETIVNREVKTKLIDILKQAGHTVVDCTSDTSELQERVDIANKNKPLDLYVSLHCNSFNKEEANGTEVFIAENSGGMYQSQESYKKNRGYAERINTNIVNQFGTRNRGVKEYNFYVLANVHSHAVLVEMFFLTNKNDYNKYNRQAEKMARAIANGIDNKINLEVKKAESTTTTPKSNIKRVIVDKKQVGAYTSNQNVANTVKEHLDRGAKNIEIQTL